MVIFLKIISLLVVCKKAKLGNDFSEAARINSLRFIDGSILYGMGPIHFQLFHKKIPKAFFVQITTLTFSIPFEEDKI